MEDVFGQLMWALAGELEKRDPGADWARALNDIIFAAHIGCLSAQDLAACNDLEEMHRLAYQRVAGSEIAMRGLE